MTAWTLAAPLVTLRDQLNAYGPGRLKVADGTIGDAAHQARNSEHNPDRRGVVRAIDLTDDDPDVRETLDDTDGPGEFLDVDQLWLALILSGDPRILYVIYKGLIFTPGRGIAPYRGENPHRGHLHLSVREEPQYADAGRPWSLPFITQTGTDMTKDQAARLLLLMEKMAQDVATIRAAYTDPRVNDRADRVVQATEATAKALQK